MPNWCYNSLLAAGEPEAVEEFRIFNAQHTHIQNHLSRPLGLIKDSQRAPGENNPRLVFHRSQGDLSFAAVTNGFGEEAWGTKWDVVGEVQMMRMDKGSWKLPHHGLTMDRLTQFTFDTAWKPPTHWMATAARSFPDVKLFLGYAEQSMDIFGVIEAQENMLNKEPFHQRGEVQPRTVEMAAARARKAMALHRKPADLLKVIWADDVTAFKAVLSRKSIPWVDEQIKSRWSALFHAAHAGSVGVANMIMDAMVDESNSNRLQTSKNRSQDDWGPFKRVKLGLGKSLGLVDICTDVDRNCGPALAWGRQKILIDAIERWPELASVNLASGVNPLSLALTYQMDPLVHALVDRVPLITHEADGRPNGVIPSLIRYYSGDHMGVIHGLTSRMDTTKRENFLRQIGKEIVHASCKEGLHGATPDAFRLFVRLDDEGLVSKEHMAIANGEAHWIEDSTKREYPISPEFKSLMAAQRALRAVDSALADLPRRAELRH